MGFDVATLAEATSVVTLFIFMAVNLALARLKLTSAPPVRGFVLPFWVPVVGVGASALVLTLEALRLIH